MNLYNITLYTLASSVFSFIGTLFLLSNVGKKYKISGHIFISLGIFSLTGFEAIYWIRLSQPALRTVSETLLWFSLLLSLVSYIIFLIWKLKWILAVSIISSISVLVYVYFEKITISPFNNPILQSKWFIPHVMVYIIAYTFLSVAFIFTILSIIKSFVSKEIPKYLKNTNVFIYLGFVLITIGLITGSFWAKDAWGHYWSWDTKEIWALLVWLLYLIYIHLNNFQPAKYKINLWIVVIAYLTLLFNWFGIQYLPTNQFSIHNFIN